MEGGAVIPCDERNGFFISWRMKGSGWRKISFQSSHTMTHGEESIWFHTINEMDSSSLQVRRVVDQSFLHPLPVITHYPSYLSNLHTWRDVPSFIVLCHCMSLHPSPCDLFIQKVRRFASLYGMNLFWMKGSQGDGWGDIHSLHRLVSLYVMNLVIYSYHASHTMTQGKPSCLTWIYPFHPLEWIVHRFQWHRWRIYVFSCLERNRVGWLSVTDDFQGLMWRIHFITCHEEKQGGATFKDLGEETMSLLRIWVKNPCHFMSGKETRRGEEFMSLHVIACHCMSGKNPCH